MLEEEDLIEILRPHTPIGPYINDITEEERMFTAYYHVRAVDRTRKLNQQISFDILSEIPTGTTTLTFSELIDEQVANITTIAQTKNIYLLWSGGIDSTVVFYALQNAGVIFTVIMNSASVEEYPLLADLIMTDQFQGVDYIFDNEVINDKLDITVLSSNINNIFITGEIGDQLMGYFRSLTYSYEDRQKHYKEVLVEMEWLHLENTVAEVVDDLSTTTTAEWLWAVNFTCKYQMVLARMTGLLGISPVRTISNCVHFFDTPNFQRWSMQNYKEHARFLTNQSYKKQFKDYIFSFNNDSVYRDTKEKEPSLMRTSYRRFDYVETKYQFI